MHAFLQANSKIAQRSEQNGPLRRDRNKKVASLDKECQKLAVPTVTRHQMNFGAYQALREPFSVQRVVCHSRPHRAHLQQRSSIASEHMISSDGQPSLPGKDGLSQQQSIGRIVPSTQTLQNRGVGHRATVNSSLL